MPQNPIPSLGVVGVRRLSWIKHKIMKNWISIFEDLIVILLKAGLNAGLVGYPVWGGCTEKKTIYIQPFWKSVSNSEWMEGRNLYTCTSMDRLFTAGHWVVRIVTIRRLGCKENWWYLIDDFYFLKVSYNINNYSRKACAVSGGTEKPIGGAKGIALEKGFGTNCSVPRNIRNLATKLVENDPGSTSNYIQPRIVVLMNDVIVLNLE